MRTVVIGTGRMGRRHIQVVTDLGDSAFLVGDTGKIVPPREPAALAVAWNALLSLPVEKRAALGKAARQRIEENFSLPAVAGKYAALYRALTALGGK
jgi:glycosyltransferase involved in cell wall biosynthesis